MLEPWQSSSVADFLALIYLLSSQHDLGCSCSTGHDRDVQSRHVNSDFSRQDPSLAFPCYGYKANRASNVMTMAFCLCFHLCLFLPVSLPSSQLPKALRSLASPAIHWQTSMITKKIGERGCVAP
ncbi:hypothetical protein EV126DRAFT_409506 [Verticillium dahliae]|nr:hypothetical protein EV126DRAFT_435644 [Verticillium dahliae]KAH6708626.1 hypothetical protein EV126DRAFT_409506 [Verticillium dahliae]